MYLITARFTMSAGWTTNAFDTVRFVLSTVTFDFPQQAVAGNLCATLAYPMAAGEILSVSVAQYSGSSKTINAGDFTMVRVCV
jgi:hypothetical protein